MNIYLVTTWPKRWLERSGDSIGERLQGLPRLGVPDLFTPEQLCHTIALAYEDYTNHGRAITHWTHQELAEEVI